MAFWYASSPLNLVNAADVSVLASVRNTSQPREVVLRFTPDQRIDINDGVEIAYWEAGHGPPVVFIHGWPLSGATYRRLAARLAEDFRCLVPDSPGLGDSRVAPGVRLDARAQANYFETFADRLAMTRFSVIAHDTGAMTARILTANNPHSVDKLVLFNTEMPGHRPPWLSRLVYTLRLPGARWVFRRLLEWPTFLWSNAGFGSMYAGLSEYKDTIEENFVRPLLEDGRRWAGSMAYAEQVRWSLVDSLAEVHARIQARVLLIWRGWPAIWKRYAHISPAHKFSVVSLREESYSEQGIGDNGPIKQQAASELQQKRLDSGRSTAPVEGDIIASYRKLKGTRPARTSWGRREEE